MCQKTKIEGSNDDCSTCTYSICDMNSYINFPDKNENRIEIDICPELEKKIKEALGDLSEYDGTDSYIIIESVIFLGRKNPNERNNDDM